MQTHIAFERKGTIGYLTLACDEPGKPPTLDLEALGELAEKVAEIRADASLRALIVQSDSAKYFCVGANINALAMLDTESIVPWVQKGHAVFDALEALPIPVIAFVRGYALGGGLELALACDFIVAHKEARFGQPEASLGVIAGWGGTYRLPRRVGVAKAKELLFSGRIISAEEALRSGLVEFVGEEAEVERYLAELLESIQKCSAVSIAQMKQLLNEGGPREGCCAREAKASRACFSTEDTRARIAGFLERRRKE